MRCFYHQDAESIGICKSCSRGLCSGCAVDVGNGLACRDTCEERVRRINELVDRNMRLSPASERLMGRQARAYFSSGAFSALAGGVFAALGQAMEGTIRVGITAAGVLFALFGIWQIVYAWGLRRATQTPRPSKAGRKEGVQ